MAEVVSEAEGVDADPPADPLAGAPACPGHLLPAQGVLSPAGPAPAGSICHLFSLQPYLLVIPWQ